MRLNKAEYCVTHARTRASIPRLLVVNQRAGDLCKRPFMLHQARAIRQKRARTPKMHDWKTSTVVLPPSPCFVDLMDRRGDWFLIESNPRISPSRPFSIRGVVNSHDWHGTHAPLLSPTSFRASFLSPFPFIERVPRHQIPVITRGN